MDATAKERNFKADLLFASCGNAELRNRCAESISQLDFGPAGFPEEGIPFRTSLKMPWHPQGTHPASKSIKPYCPYVNAVSHPPARTCSGR
jgi:hypothetical protein